MQPLKSLPTQQFHDELVAELKRFKAMTTEEYVLWQKWEEVSTSYPMHYSMLVDEWAHTSAADQQILQLVRSKLYDETDFTTINPELIRSDDTRDQWTALRIMIHTQQHSGAIGRALNYIVRDRTTKKYLGVISIASDFLDLKGRDDAIGWTRHQRTIDQRIKHTAVCSTIVPVQPFGYNLLGGKLLALLCLSDQVQQDWQSVYGSKLVGLTTTSLYGRSKGGHGMSQYDNLKFWKKMGYSSGSTALRMSVGMRQKANQWAIANCPELYYEYLVAKDDDGMGPRDKLNRFQQKLYTKLGIKSAEFRSNHDRGIYFAPLYTNTNEFLRDEISESDLVCEHDWSIANLTRIWAARYATKRYESLLAQGRLKTDPLWYEDLATMDWDAARTKYLADVGR